MLIQDLKRKIDRLYEFGVPPYLIVELQEISKSLEKEMTSNQNNSSEVSNILIVDDSEDVRELLKITLKNLPYQFDTAENGAVAVEKIKSHNYDVVLMDIQMPVLNGYMATRQIREWEQANNRNLTPIIAMTANPFPGDRERSLDIGCSEHIEKPIDRDILVGIIEKCIYYSQQMAV